MKDVPLPYKRVDSAELGLRRKKVSVSRSENLVRRLQAQHYEVAIYTTKAQVQNPLAMVSVLSKPSEYHSIRKMNRQSRAWMIGGASSGLRLTVMSQPALRLMRGLNLSVPQDPR